VAAQARLRVAVVQARLRVAVVQAEAPEWQLALAPASAPEWQPGAEARAPEWVRQPARAEEASA
jgi:hypothetical protein